MKRILSLLFLTVLTVGMLHAQTDPKYLEGAVPMVDGKVSFTTEMNVGTMSKEQLFETLLDWANKRFQTTEKFKARILYSNPEEGSIAVAGDEYIVFSSTALALDRSRIHYQLLAFCDNGKCKINMTRIRYHYMEERDGGEKYEAEEWITDEFSLNKAKTKLYPISGKFRRKTIDLKDELFNEIRSTLGNQMIALGLKPAPTTPESQVAIVQQPVAPAVPAVTETVQAPATTEKPQPKAEADLTQQATRITLTAGGETLEIGKECWGGKNQLFGKDVTYCIIDTQKAMANMLLVQNDTYSISFYLPESSTPCMVINCKKMMLQNVKGEEAKKMNPACDANKAYNVYVGEIVK